MTTEQALQGMDQGPSRVRRAGAWITLNDVTKTKTNRGPCGHHPGGRREFHVSTHPTQRRERRKVHGKLEVLNPCLRHPRAREAVHSGKLVIGGAAMAVSYEFTDETRFRGDE